MQKKATHCTVCGVELTTENRPKVGGKCKPCLSAYQHQWYEENKTEVLQKTGAYQREHPEQYAAYSAAWRQRNPDYVGNWQKNNRDKARAAGRRHYASHKDQYAAYRRAKRQAIREYHRSYYQINQDKILQRSRDYYESHKEQVNARNRANYHKSPIKHRTYWMRRRALIHDRSATKVDFAAILRRDGWICHICGQFVAPGELSFDHIKPLRHGGKHHENNIAVAHLVCNKRKGAKLDVVSLAPPRIKL